MHMASHSSKMGLLSLKNFIPKLGEVFLLGCPNLKTKKKTYRQTGRGVLHPHDLVQKILEKVMCFRWAHYPITPNDP